TLPARVGDRVASHPGKPAAVRLGQFQAYVWRNVTERGTRKRITLYATGTDNGLVALACRGPAAAVSRCERSAGSLSVPGAVPADLSALDSWTRSLDRLMRR